MYTQRNKYLKCFWWIMDFSTYHERNFIRNNNSKKAHIALLQRNSVRR